MNLRDIKLRMRSVRKTQQITRAMKMVAAVKFRHAQARLLKARPYAARIRDLTARALSQADAAGEPHPLMQARAGRRILLLVVSSDKGLCGSFNSNLYRALQRYLREQGAGPAEARPEVELLLIGRKIHDLCKRLQHPALAGAARRFLPLAEADSAAIGQELINHFTKGRYDRIEAIYTEFKSILQNRVVHEPLLPLAPLPAEPGGQLALNALVEPELSVILADLLPRFLLSRIQQMLLESQTSEQGTRMNMMDQATKNADDLIDQLMLEFNKARQWGITRELSDITTGAEAMA